MNYKLEFCRGLPAMTAMLLAAMLMVACGGGSDSESSNLSQSTSRKGVGTLTPPPATGNNNVVPIVVDAGLIPGSPEINIAYVSVTVCTPGTTTANCQTIDHVMLDTGSSGLRLLNSALYSNLDLPQVTNSSGQALGECMTFAIGTTWGSVRSADIYLGGEIAASVPIQVIGDQPGGVSTIPSDCSSAGSGIIQNTQADLGANGVLGVGLFVNDCDICSSPVVPPMYYTCTSNCTSSGVDTVQLVKNPVALFQQDSNGVLIKLPVVPDAGATSLTGSLIFGIGTQTNNALGSAIVYPTDASGNFSTTYKSSLMTGSYIDSGSNALFFNDSIPICSTTTWTYCPNSSPLLLSATNAGAGGSPSGTVNFSIVAVDPLGANVVAANIGGPYGNYNPQFGWGLPFFFGRSVFTAISGMNTPGGSGPYFAY